MGKYFKAEKILTKRKGVHIPEEYMCSPRPYNWNLKHNRWIFNKVIMFLLANKQVYGHTIRSVLWLVIGTRPQALVSFKKYMPPPLPYFKVNIYPFPLPHFASNFPLICDPFADPIISLHSRYIWGQLARVAMAISISAHGSH